MGHDSQRLEVVFDAALAKADPAERAAYVAAACGDNADLRRQVERLLGAHFGMGDFLKPPPPETGTGTADHGPPASAEGVGAVLAGKYKLLEAVGEGGMGSVFLAQQTQPVRRLVAVKVIKPGMDSALVLARFEAERQALALMDHPHIARVLDAGATDAGRPFFVMELVKGVPITQFCDTRRLTPRERLHLFIPVCQAIQHAHQKGIIHRDVKPSNVLVALYDGRPVPKVIDFGVAKAIGQPLTDRTLVTGFGAVVGTLEYMSPEQAEPNQLDIDTRSDVYSLGVLLYELLTGSTPLDRKRHGSAGFAETLRRIREEEPPRPSTRLSSSDALPRIAADRQTEPAKLTRLVRGELDWIVMKALEKDRNRRYETANGLAKDIERYLNDEPVAAGPPGAGYRLHKFLRRHRGPVFAASVVLLALVLGIAGTTWGLVRASEALEAAERATDKEAVERKQAEAVAGLLVSVFRQLDPGAEQRTGLGLKEQLVAQLDRAAADLEKEDAGEPQVRARLRNALGQTQLGLGEWAKAEVLFQAVLEEQRRRFGDDHSETLAAQINLGVASMNAGRFAQAIQTFEQVRDRRLAALGPDHPATLAALHYVAAANWRDGRPDQAIRLYEPVRERRVAVLGPDHPATLVTTNNLALAYLTVGRAADAIPLLEHVHDRRAATLGPDHPYTLLLLHNLGGAYKEAGRNAEAETFFSRARDGRLRKLGPDHPATLKTLHSLATVYQRTGRTAEAIQLFEQVGDRQAAKLGPAHPDTLTTRTDLAAAWQDDRQFDRAAAAYREVLAAPRKSPEAPLKRAGTHAALGGCLLQAGKPVEAESVLRDSLAIRQRKQPDAWTTFETQSLLGGALLGQQKYAEAEPLLVAGYEGLKQRAAKIPTKLRPDRLAAAIGRLVQLYEATGQDEKAAAWRTVGKETAAKIDSGR